MRYMRAAYGQVAEGKGVRMSYQIACDVHTHTLFSRHAYSTIAENVSACRDRGIELLGSTDHFSEMLFPGQHLRNFQYFLNQNVWPRVWDGVVVLRGAEVDIVSLDGELFGQDIDVPDTIVGRPYREARSLFDHVTEPLDYLIASVHNGEFTNAAPIARTTGMYVRALENPKVFILGHTGRSGVPFDYDEVLTVAKEKHKLIEINEHSLEVDSRGWFHSVCSRIAQRCAEMGVGIAVSTDAHVAPVLGSFPHAQAMLEGIGFPQELIMNRDRRTFLGALADAGICNLCELADLAEYDEEDNQK